MKLHSDSFDDGAVIPGKFAFGVIDPDQHVALSDNHNPHLAWTEVPADAKSFVITCIDVDVPTRGDDVNQEGRTVPAELPRTEFVHWLMANIPAEVREIAAGSCSDAVIPRGKAAPNGPAGSVQGVNDYTGWFAGDADMAGTWRGYDGPCPPWNDSIIHHYHFSVYALDVERLDLPEDFDLAALRAAVDRHVVGRASIHGTYSLNPDLAGA